MKKILSIFVIIILIPSIDLSCRPREPERAYFTVAQTKCVIQTPMGKPLNQQLVEAIENEVEPKAASMDPQAGNILGKLNNSEIGELVPAGDLFSTLSDLLKYSNDCYGAFNPTIQILWELYDFEYGGRQINDADIIQALRYVDVNQIELDRGAILRKNGITHMGFGPVLNGAVADWLTGSLAVRGIDTAVIHAGGARVYVGGLSENDLVYAFMYPLELYSDEVVQLNVGNIKLEKGEYIGAVDDNIDFFFAGGKAYHRVIEPLNGKPVHETRAAVVVSKESALQAMAFAYALMVMGLDRGLEFMDEVSGQNVVGGLIMTQDHQVHVSGGLENRFWR